MIQSIGRKSISIAVLVFITTTSIYSGITETSESGDQSTKQEISEVEQVLDIIVRADTMYVQDWTEEEIFTVAHSDGAAKILIGISREELVDALGEPDLINDNGSEEWSIGKLKEIEMNPAPVLIFEYDENSKVVDIYHRLGM